VVPEAVVTLDFSDVRLIVAGDVCEDVIIVGTAKRFSRETPGLPVIDVEHSVTIDGCTASPFRQVQALGAQAFLVPTGRSCVKSRLLALQDGDSREVARWDGPWPPEDVETFRLLFREAGRADGLLFSQYRPGRPMEPLLRLVRRFKGLKVVDARDPGHFAGFDVLKIGMDDAWRALRQPRPRRTPERAAQAALAFGRSYGYRLAVVTMGAEGYAASTDEGTAIMEHALPGGWASPGAGDVFVATLTCALAAGHETREALKMANTAAGLACRKGQHLGVVTLEELREAL